MDEEKALDEYIQIYIPLLDRPLTLEERKLISNTFGFRRYYLSKQVEKLKESLIFPFNLIFEKGKKK